MNLRFALRQLSRTPGYTALAVLTLALGIGVNTALYTLIDSVLRRPVAGVGESSTLVWIGSNSRDRQRPAGISYQDADRLRAEVPLFEDLATSRQMPLSVGAPSGPVKVDGVAVSGNYFRMLRTKFVLGRGFTWAEDSAAVTRPVIVLGYEGWQRYFNGDSSIIGRTLMVNGLAATVVGVTTPGFNGVEHDEVQRVAWVPSSLLAVLLPDWKWMTTDASTTNIRGVARLRSLSDRPRADAALARIAAVIRADDTTRANGWMLKTYDASSGLPAGGEVSLRPIGILCFTVTGLILLICCANVANLALARALGRQREIATRLSLGASRSRIIRQLLGESLLLSVIGSIAGLIVATWAVDLILRFALPPLGLDVSLDLRMFVVSAALGVTAAVLFGLAPALHATRDGVSTVLRSGAADGGRERTRLQSSLVVAQVALSLTLLTLSGLFIRALGRAQHVEVGFDASERVLAVSVDVSLQRYDSARTAQFVMQLAQRARALPGVESASTTTFLPLTEWSGVQVTVDGQATEAGSRPTGAALTTFNAITPGYFKTLSIPLMSGRDFTDADKSGAPPVAIVSEGFARRRLSGMAPLGARISVSGAKGPWFTVVGVAGDAMVRSLDGAASAAVYLPWHQFSVRYSTTVLVRASRGGAAALAPSVLGVIRELDPLLPAFRQLTLDEVRNSATKNERIGAIVLAIFGALALVLASVGLYGALLFSVRQRTREIGIRVALGATRAGVISLFLRRGLRLTFIGVAIGVVLALASTRLTRTLLFGVSPTDGVTFAAVALLFTGVAIIASWLPARRAARVDPVIAMRAD